LIADRGRKEGDEASSPSDWSWSSSELVLVDSGEPSTGLGDSNSRLTDSHGRPAYCAAAGSVLVTKDEVHACCGWMWGEEKGEGGGEDREKAPPRARYVPCPLLTLTAKVQVKSPDPSCKGKDRGKGPISQHFYAAADGHGQLSTASRL
jgi:hypothetical protein